MFIYDICITLLLSLILFKTTVTPKLCNRKEDCSKQLDDNACSFCVGDIGSTKCIYPFPNQYKIIPKTMRCTYWLGFCNENKPCKNGSNCLDRLEEIYLCECKPYYVGKDCDIKYDKIKTFNLMDIDFIMSIQMCRSSTVDVVLSISKNVQLNELRAVTEDGYRTNLKHDKTYDEKCDKFTCTRKYKADVRYLYWPYNEKSNDFLYLGKNVLGYFTKLQLDIVHQGVTIYNSEFKLFVFYPEKNICVPKVEVSECETDHKSPSVYNMWSEIIISSSVRIFPNGNSRNPYGEKNNAVCGSKSGVNLSWKVWWLREEVWMPDTVVVERFREERITLDPRTDGLGCGLYRVELDARNVFSEGSSETFDTCYFKIETVPLEAIIEGGTHRSVAKKDGLLLSAVNSKDPNHPEHDSIITKWSCTVLKSNETNSNEMCKPVTLKKNQPYLIPADKLLEGEYNFTLEIWSDYYKDRTSCECDIAKKHQFSYQIVEVTNKTNLVILCQINCGRRVSVDNDLILKVSYLDDKTDLSYRWTYEKVGSERKESMSKINKYPPYVFLISEGTLETSTQYKVLVTVFANGNLLSQTYSFETDEFIYSGNCSIDPDSGVRGITYFYIKCSPMENKALIFEFFDKTSEEKRENVSMSGRMLGTSSHGEIDAAILTRGFLVVYVLSGYNRCSKTYEVKLTDDDSKRDALLNKILYNPLYFKEMPFPLLMQHISSVPDILTNNMTQKMFLDIILNNLSPCRITVVEEAKLNSIILYNVLLKLGKGNMDLNSVKLTRILTCRIIKILTMSLKNNVKPINPKVAKEIIGVVLNVLELSLDVQNKTEVDGTSKYLTVDKFFRLTYSSELLMKVFHDVQRVLNVLQKPGLPPTKITSDRNSFTFNVLQDDPKYNFSLSQILELNTDIPVTISSVLMNRLHNIAKVEENLSLNVAIVNNNVFKWFNNHSVSNLLIISLNKYTKEKKRINIKKLNSPIDMEVQFNNTNTKVKNEKRVSQTISLDPSSDESSLDFQIRVHRLDPNPGSLLAVTFLYPPTNVTLRVLIMEDYRPTYEMMMSDSILISEKSPYYSPNGTRTKANTFYYMAVIPGPGTPLSRSVPFSFMLNSTACVSWQRVRWSAAGCSVGSNSSGHAIHCQCNHLSVFGAISPYLPNLVNPFADAKLFFTVRDNPLVVSLMVILLVLYVILSVVCHKMDKKDRFRGAITVLEDNFPEDRHPYILAVYTSSRLFAGTSANVGVQLIGELSNSRAHILKSKYYRVLNRQSDDWFLILCPKPLGLIKYLHIWHDDTGSGPGWYCDKVHVYDIHNSLECLFIVEQWLELNVNKYPEALVIPASTDDIIKINRVLSNNFSECYQDRQSGTGLFSHHPRSTLTRIQRVNIFMCSLLITLLCSVMFYTDQKKEKPDSYRFVLKEKDLYISFVTLVVIVAVNYVINLLFQKSFKRVSVKNRSSLYLRRSIFLDEYFDAEQKAPSSNIFSNKIEEQKGTTKSKGLKKKLAKTVKNKMKSQNLAPAVLPNGDCGIRIKKFWLTLAWATCGIIIVLCTYLIMLYGLKMGLVKSKKWLSSVTLAFIHDKVVLNPVSVIILAVSITTSFGFVARSSSYRVTEDEIEMSVDKMHHDTIEALVDTRQQPMYSPMKAETRKDILKEKLIILNRFQFLKFFLSVCYIVNLIYTVNQIRRLHFTRNVHLKTMINSACWSKHSIAFFEAYDKEELGDYFENTFLRVIYKSRWYNTISLSHNLSSLFWTSDYSWRMVGVPYLRQQRVYEEACNSFVPPVNGCIPSCIAEDTDSYSVGWSVYSPYDMGRSSSECPWIYTPPSASWLKTLYRLEGKSGRIYNNGGYRAKLATSIQGTVKVVAQLIDKRWVDKFTKVVFAELTVYNVNQGCLGQITLFVEFLTSGVSLKEARITTMNVDCDGLKIRHIVFIALTLLFLIEIFLEINYSGFINFFRDIRNGLLVTIAIPSTLVIIAFLVHVYKCVVSDLWERYYDKQNDSFDFDTFLSFHTYILFLLSFFILFGILRTLLLLWSLKVIYLYKVFDIHKLFNLSLAAIFSLLLLSFICLIYLFIVLISLDISTTSHHFMDLLVSQKKQKLLGIGYFELDSVLYSCVKFCALLLMSSFLITTLIHFSPMSRFVEREKKNSVFTKKNFSIG